MNYKIGEERIYNTQFDGMENVVLWDVLSVKEEQELNLEILSTNSRFKQGIRLAIDAGEGYLDVNGIQSKEIHLWEDTIPPISHIKCKSEAGLLSIYNIFDLGKDRGGVRAQVDSCGMIVEQNENVIIYKCNDIGFQSDFDKLIFRLELL